MSSKPILTPALRSAARLGRRRLLYSETGKLIGQSHPKAVLTDAEVDLMLELRAEGKAHLWLAEKFEVSVHTVRSICRGRTRSVAIARVVTAGRREQ